MRNLYLAWDVEIKFTGRVFGIGDALEHEPERDIAEKFAVGDKRGISLRGGRGEEDWRTASVRKSVHAKDVAHRALGRRVAAD